MRNLIARAVFKELLVPTSTVTLCLHFCGLFSVLIKQLVVFLMMCLMASDNTKAS